MVFYFVFEFLKMFYVYSCFAFKYVCAQEGQKNGHDTLELELELAMNLLVGAEPKTLNQGHLQEQ